MSGACVLPDGSPAAGLFVQLRGKLKSADEEGSGQVWRGEPTDKDGRFTFKDLAEGTYDFEVRGNREHPVRGKLEAIEVSGSVPIDSLRIETRAAMVVKGRIELTGLAKTPNWTWLQFQRVQADDATGERGRDSQWASVDRDDSTFSCDDLEPGRWSVRLHASYGDGDTNETYECTVIDVPPQGIPDLRLVPQKRV